MSIFGRSKPVDNDAEDADDDFRMRLTLLERREQEATRREKELLVRQNDLERRLHELTQRESRLSESEAKARLESEMKLVEGRPVRIPKGPITRRGNKSSRSVGTGPSGSGPGAKQANGGDAGGSSSDSGADLLSSEASNSLSDQATLTAIRELQEWEQRKKAEEGRLQQWADHLDHLRKDVEAREERAKALEKQISNSGSGVLPVGQDGLQAARIRELEKQLADLQAREADAANQQFPELEEIRQRLAGREATLQARGDELDRQLAQLKEREAKLFEQVHAQADESAKIRQQTNELRKAQDNLYRTQEELENRQLELDKREVELMALQTELREAEERLERQKRALKGKGDDSGMFHTEVLPSYVSDLAVLKADQIRLQERMMAGLTSDAEGMSHNVLFS